MSAADLERSGRLRRRVPLAPLTTYKFGGGGAWFGEPSSEEELLALVEAASELGVEVVVLGRGSNVVVSDRGLEAMVIRLAGVFAKIAQFDATAEPGGALDAGAAVPLPRLARHSVDLGRGGLEFFVGIPGSVGGAVRMNAGCFGTETADRLIDARILDIPSRTVAIRGPDELNMAYRSTSLGADHVVLSARFATEPRDSRIGRARLREVTRWRRDHQPGGTFNAGSVFKNPPDDAAGRIIDELGLKGFRIRGASVSARHANFFEAGEGATAQDVRDLVGAVRRRVGEATGIWLEPEIAFLGEFDGPALPGGSRRVQGGGP